MLNAKSILNVILERNFSFATGTPCSLLQPLIDEVYLSSLQYHPSLNEGDATAMAAGATLAGKKSVVFMQNSGLGNAVNPLTSLLSTFKIPMLFVVSLRDDEPQHELMGKITPELIELLEANWAYVPEQEEELQRLFDKIDRALDEKKSFFLVVKKNSLRSEQLQNQVSTSVSRREVLSLIQQQCKEMAIIATTGKTSRELYELGDNSQNFYMVGSMGCASALGLGVALSTLDKQVLVIDGDGALLMRPQNMAQIGIKSPENLIHLLLDNGVHDSTGGQKTNSGRIDFVKIANAVGYKHSLDIYSLDELSNALKKKDGPIFIRMHISPGSPQKLARPSVSPPEVAERFKRYLEKA